MVITLTGANSFALSSELKQRTAAFTKEHGDLALERLDGEEVEFGRLREALTSLPFLASQKLVVLRAPSKNKQFVEGFEQLFDEIPESTDVILVEPKLDKRLSYYKFLKTKTDFYNFAELDTSGLARWLVDTTKAQNGALSPADARYLVERVGSDQQLLGNELEKLLIRNPQISRADIDDLTEPTPQSTIFQLLEAAFAGRPKKALELYQEQRALKVEPQQIIAILAWQLHILALIKTAGDRSADDIARDAKLNPYVVRKSQGITRKLSLHELKKLVADLLEIDKRSKSSALDIDEALQHYLLTVSEV